MNIWTKLRDSTVFWHVGPYKHANERLAVYSHRGAALIYLIYAAWGILSIIGSVPSIAEALGHIPQIFFSFIMVLITIPAFVGASFFPRLARLELFSASSLAMALAVYEAIILLSAIGGDFTRWASVVLISSTLIIPVTRIIFIYVTLIQSADSTRGK